MSQAETGVADVFLLFIHLFISCLSEFSPLSTFQIDWIKKKGPVTAVHSPVVFLFSSWGFPVSSEENPATAWRFEQQVH